jgi:hypothetical protein
MNILTDYPIIPVITFLLIVVFFAYQIHMFLKERSKSKTPKLPNMAVQNATVHPAKLVIPDLQKKTAQKVVDPKKKYGPIVRMLSLVILLLVVISTMGIFYVFRNQNFVTIPRASEPNPSGPFFGTNVTPTTVSETLPLVTGGLSPSPISPLALTPTIAPLANKPITTVPTSGLQTTAVPTKATTKVSPTITNKVIQVSPTITFASPTTKPTLTAMLSPRATTAPQILTTSPKPLQSVTPSPVLVARISVSMVPSGSTALTPTITGVDTTITPSPTKKPSSDQKNIPEAGMPWYLGAFVVGSVIFLAIGFIW